MKNQTTLKVANSIQRHCLKWNPKTENRKETPRKRKFVYFAWEKDLLVDGRPALLSENTVAFRQSSNFPFDSGRRPVTLKANFSSSSGQKGNAKRVREERRRVRDASKSVLTMEGTKSTKESQKVREIVGEKVGRGSVLPSGRRGDGSPWGRTARNTGR